MQPQFKRRLLKYKRQVFTIIFVVFFCLSAFFLIKSALPLIKFANKNKISPRFLWNLATGRKLPLKNYQGKANMVILGVSGGEHEGADLTDTIIFLSLDLSSSSATMVSIPRDLWLASLKAKINAAYHYGEEKKKGSGPLMAKVAVEEVIGQPVYYALVIDFSGFQKLIDLVEGVDIQVEKAFSDDHYPIAGYENDFCGGDPKFACRYEQLYFDEGLQHMDGERALKYVRSRQAVGDEGTDFARSARQQQVITALKDKILKFSFWKDPKKLGEFINTANQMIQTDMNWSEKITLAKLSLNFKNKEIRHLILDAGDTLLNPTGKRKGFLVNPPEWEYDGLWILAPRTGNFDEIHKYIACQLSDPNCPVQP